MEILPISATLDFDLGDQIGEGGEAKVHKAFDKQLNAAIAVKKVPIAAFNDIDQFFEESRKLYLTRHHNIVEVMYGCKNDDQIFLAMPFYKNGSLEGSMSKRFLTTREIIRYSLQFLSGLNNVHSKKHVHYDIKCENILISDTNTAMLSDFGLAQYTSRFGFAESMGTTEPYAPPEFFNQAEHNSLFDIYQAGLAIYRMCVGDKYLMSQYEVAGQKKGTHDHDRDTLIKALQKGHFPDRSFWIEHIPLPLRTIIRKAMSIDPNERYTSVIQMLNDISKMTSASDWQFFTNYHAEEKWTQENMVVTATRTNSGWDVETRKNGKRKVPYCGSNLNLSDKRLLLYQCLSEDWS